MKTIMKITATVVLAFSGSVLAGGDPVTPEILALRDFSASVVNIEKRDTECKHQKQELPYSEIQALGLSVPSLKVALRYHFANASYLCVKSEISEFLLSTAALKDLAKETPQTKAFKEGLDGGNSLMITHLSQTYKAKADYLALTKSERDSIETISALKTPFDLMVAAQALDLFTKQQ